MSPTSFKWGEQTLTAGEHISQLVETLIGRFFFLKKKNLNNGVITIRQGDIPCLFFTKKIHKKTKKILVTLFEKMCKNK